MTDALRKLSPLRVAVRPDFEPVSVDLPAGAPTRTQDGKAWVRWANYGSYSGWYAVGSRKAHPVGRPSFWEAVFVVACECAGGTVDQAHCCGRGVLSIGGLGVTMRSGYAQLLLHCCLIANPARFLEVMAPVISESGAYLKVTDKSPSGVALGWEEQVVTEEKDLRALVMRGSDSVSWTSGQKKRAKTWVSCCSKLLRDETMDKAQLTFLEEITPAFLTEPTKAAVKWPRNGPRDWWMYTPEQQLLWGLALVLALDDEKQTEMLMVEAVAAQHAEPDAPFGAEYILRQIRDLVQQTKYEEIWRGRCLAALKLLCVFMQVKL